MLQPRLTENTQHVNCKVNWLTERHANDHCLVSELTDSLLAVSSSFTAIHGTSPATCRLFTPGLATNNNLRTSTTYNESIF